MTPNEKTKFKDQAQTRALSVFSSNHEAKRIDTDSYVEGYADQADATEAIRILGFETTSAFRAYLNQLLGVVEVPADLLDTAVTAILNDPGKLKNYPFPITAEAMQAMAN